MNPASVRLRYNQLFIICLLGVSFYTVSQSLAGGIPNFDQNIWGKQTLVSDITTLKLSMGDRVFPQAVVGKDGWLEYINDLSNYKKKTISAENLNTLQKKIQKLYSELQKKGITLIIIIPPSKATIYPDKIPNEIQKSNAPSSLDLFSTYLKQKGPPVLVDLTAPLLEERKKHDIYYKTDTHWNPYGAFVAYREVMTVLAKTYPQLQPKSIDNFSIKTGKPKLNDIPKVMGAIYLLEPRIDITVKKTAISHDKSPLKLLMFTDSFGHRMQKFIMPHFQKTIIFSNLATPKTPFSKTIDTIQPDVVIIEFVERYFDTGKLDKFLNKLLAE